MNHKNALLFSRLRSTQTIYAYEQPIITLDIIIWLKTL